MFLRLRLLTQPLHGTGYTSILISFNHVDFVFTPKSYVLGSFSSRAGGVLDRVGSK